MISEFTTKGREGGGRDGFGLCVATSEDALGPVVVNTYRSGFGPFAAAVPPNRGFLPGSVLGTCGGLLTEDSAPRLFNSLKSLALKLCNQPRDLFVKSRERLCVSVFQSIPLPFVQFTTGKFQWKRKSLPTIPVTA
jgi:hypothetical protein